MTLVPPTIFIVDDDASVRAGTRRLLRSLGYETEVFSQAAEFLAQEHHGPGCVLVDLNMPEMNGLEFQVALARRGSAMPLIFISGQGDIPSTVRAMKGGALDFLTKPFDQRTLMEAIERALRLDRELRQSFVERQALQALFDTLTPREREVCGLVSRGMLNKQVAWELGTSEKTIKIHRARVMDKLKVGSLAELVRAVDRISRTTNA